MTLEWEGAADSFVRIFANMDFSSGPLFYVLGIVLAGFCCMEGFKIYKMILGALGFVFGYRLGFAIFSRFHWADESLLMAEVFCGLIFMALAYTIYLAGIFIAAFQFCFVNFPVYIEKFAGDRLHFGSVLNGLIVTVIALVLAFVAAKFAVGMSRVVIVCLTAVIGGFAIVNYFLGLLSLFPYEVRLPEPASGIWLLAKVFLSAAGAGIQGLKGDS